MNIQFKHLKLNNFLSFGEADLDLTPSGYTLIKGQNDNPDDNATSNGSGKSSLIESILWALTGETVRGTKDVVNINGTDGAYVELDFALDKHEYKIIRTKDHSQLKTNLKVYIDGEDKSGKGIRDTEKLLSQYLPDITSQLLGSVIILGQGLPSRFTSNTPAGRKEILEQLSKSDFMIADLKDRIRGRINQLDMENTAINNKHIELSTTQQMLSTQKLEAETKLNTLLNTSLDLAQLVELENQLQGIDKSLQEEADELADCEWSQEIAKQQKETILKDCNSKLEVINFKYKNDLNILQEKFVETKTNIGILEAEIKRLESITDVCPTCGQKIPGAQKSDTTTKHEELKLLQEDYASTLDNIKYYNDLISEETIKLKSESDETLSELDDTLGVLETEAADRNLKVRSLTNQKTTIEAQKTKLELEIKNFEANKLDLQNTINNLTNRLEEISQDLLYNNSEQLNIIQHQEVVNKMSTIIARDFRGKLLSNVIDFINRKAKEYCQDIFETDKLNFILDGNAISISYDNKEYENLSGGEQKKVDLIVQFAIRDMLCKYLNFSSNILVLDEIFDALDYTGCQRVINLITTKLTDVANIYIISHRADLPITYDQQILVIKGTDKCSRIITNAL